MGESMSEPKYPELDKMLAVRDKSRLLSEFLDWLASEGIALCELNTERRGGEFERIQEGYEKLLARFFEIDLDKIEEERRALLDSLRQKAEQQEKRK